MGAREHITSGPPLNCIQASLYQKHTANEKKITKGNEGNMLQGHFIVGKGAKEVCINTPVPPFLCVFMAPYFKH